MADTNIEAKNMWLYIDPTGGTTYDNIICLTDFTVSNSATNSSTRETFCGTKTSSGGNSTTVALNGEIIIDPSTHEISAPDLFTLSQNGTKFSFKQESPAGVAGFPIRTGKGILTAYTETYNSTDVAKFSATITMDGILAQSIHS